MHYIRATLLSAVVISFISISLVGSNPDPDTVPIDGSYESQISDAATAASGQSDDELSLLFLIHRHGDRAPISYAPKDPYGPIAEGIWRNGLGMLTNGGKDRMYKLGKYLRRRYADFLGTPNPRQVYARSSDVHRCIESAQLVLAGMYPPVGESVWNKDLPWQPIAIHTRPFDDDPMLNPESYCPARQDEYDREFFSEENRKKVYGVMEDAKSLTERLAAQYGVSFDDLYRYYDLSSTLNIESEYNLPLPDWVSENLGKLHRIAYTSELTWTKTDRMKRLFAGVVINDIVEKMNEYRAQRDGIVDTDRDASDPVKKWEYNYKLFEYGTHDTNIHSILNTLGVYQTQVPELPYFGTSILVELHRSKQRPDYSVKLFYLAQSRDEEKGMRELTLTDCLKEGDTKCSLDGFASYTKPIRLNEDDWFLECNRTSTADGAGPPKKRKIFKSFLKGIVCGAGDKCE